MEVNMKREFLVTPIPVANTILSTMNKKNIQITPSQLYSIIYLIYAEYLYLTGKKLFNELFEVTKEGPILPSVYFKFNSYGDKTIKSEAPDARNNVFLITDENKVFNYCLNHVISLYELYYPQELNEIITKKNSAYDKAIKSNSKVLSDDDILKEFIEQKSIEL